MVKNNGSTCKILWKSFCLGLKVKTPISLLISLLGILAALLPLLLSRQLQRLTDLLLKSGVQGGQNLSMIMNTMMGVGVLFLLQMFFQAMGEYSRSHDISRARVYVKEFVLRQICYVHYSYIENRDDFLKKIEFANSYFEVEIAQNIQAIFVVLQKMITVISVSAALWMIHPAIIILIICTSVPAAIVSYKQSDETFRLRAKWMDEGALTILMYHWCAASDYGIQELRHYELFDYLKARWRAVADGYLYKKNKMLKKHLQSNLLADFLRSSVYVLILLLTVREIYCNPTLGLGVFTLVYTLSDKLQKTFSDILTQTMQFAGSFAYLQEFFLLEDLEREDKGEEVCTFSDDFRGEICFEGVSFTYPNSEQEVLHEISVSIRKGEKIAIVGDNGSGKSTFISLLTGMFSPDKGRIEINGCSMEKHKKELRKRISVIFQDFARYDDTLRENIVVSDGTRTSSDEELFRLAQKIHVEDVIKEQSDGLDTILGRLSEKGNDLSKGQWQKIVLLRAVYRNDTDIMILDEPTAALDPVAETELYRNFSEITEDKTTLLISHRLGITKLVDRILVFKDGRVIEDGSHQELMENRGHYYHMYQAQASWYQ